MDAILAVWWLAFGPDVTALGDRDFAVRDAAHRRLTAWSWAAVPALWLGERTAGAEGRHRIGMLLDRLPTYQEAMAFLVFSVPDLPDEHLRGVAKAMDRDCGLAVELCERLDRTGHFGSQSSLRWVEIRPYASGSRAGDFLHVIRSVRDKLHRRPAEKPVPMRMPPTCLERR